MALGPEASEAAKRTRERAREEQQKREQEAARNRALQLVDTVAYYAEKVFDKQIRECDPPFRIGAHNISDASRYSTRFIPFVDYYRFRCTTEDVRLVLKYAPEELIEALKSRYLPKGWKNVRYEYGIILE